MASRIAWLCLMLSAMAPCRLLAATLTYPLQGYYRVGCHMPVAFAGAFGHGDLVIAGKGAFTTRVVAPAGMGIAPVLIQDSSFAGIAGAPAVHQLTTQRFIGVVSPIAAADYAQSADTIAVQIDPESLLNDYCNFDALDLLVMDEATARPFLRSLRFQVNEVVDLLITGSSPTPPDDFHPWQHEQRGWYCKAPPKLIIESTEHVLDPLASWAPAQSPNRRLATISIAVALTALLLGSLLLSLKLQFVSFALVCVIGCGAGWMLEQFPEKPALVYGAIEHNTPGWFAQDIWEYQVGQGPIELAPVTLLAAGAGQAELQCNSYGYTRAWKINLEEGQPLATAFCERFPSTQKPVTVDASAPRGPMQPLVNSVYRGARVLGATTPRGPWTYSDRVILSWPVTVIEQPAMGSNAAP